MSEQFKRENRYAVIKLSDLDDLGEDFTQSKKDRLKANFLKQLDNIGWWAEEARKEKGKKPLECVVIESDWPEYEIVWKMIEDRMSGKAALSQQEAVSEIYQIKYGLGSWEEVDREQYDRFPASKDYQLRTLYTAPPSTAQGVEEFIHKHWCEFDTAKRERYISVDDLRAFLSSQPTAQDGMVMVPVELLEAIANTGNDFGFGAYEVEEKFIKQAQDLLKAASKGE